MRKFYHMIIERKGADIPNAYTCAGCVYAKSCPSFDRERVKPCGGKAAKCERREYISTKQGSAPAGWVCVGVCGYHEK